MDGNSVSTRPVVADQGRHLALAVDGGERGLAPGSPSARLSRSQLVRPADLLEQDMDAERAGSRCCSTISSPGSLPGSGRRHQIAGAAGAEGLDIVDQLVGQVVRSPSKVSLSLVQLYKNIIVKSMDARNVAAI